MVGMHHVTIRLLHLAVASSLLCALAIGCAPKQVVPEPSPEVKPPAAPPPAPPPEHRVFPATIEGLKVHDERSDVGEPGRILYMPEAGIVGKKYDLNPELGDEQLDLIESEVRSYFGPGERRVGVDVYVLRGHQSFEIGEMRELVDVEFALRVEIGDNDDIQKVWLGSGEASFKTDAVDVPRQWVDGKYADAIRESVEEAFVQIFGEAE